MNTNDTLLLQALKLKQLSTGSSLPGDPVEQIALGNPDFIKDKMRNICAFVSVEMFGEVDEICQILSLSKRQFVEMALIDLLEKAYKTLDETGAFKSIEVT